MSNYWTKRFEEEEKQRNISNKAYAKEIEKQYKIAENKIKSDIEKWYIRIADNNQISLADAKKLLTKDELKEFKWTLAEYTQKAKSGAWKKELENASARIHIQRLEALQLQVQNSIETLRNKENEMLEDYLIKNYEDTYYHSLYEISKGLNLKTSFATLDKNKINQVIGKPWLKDGKTFSDRIWQDKEQLINTLRTKITQSFITGSTLDEAVEDISKFVSDKIKNKEYVARRLLETESAAYASKAQIEAFKSIDVDKYEIVATLDLHTSEICQEMDGKVFKLSDQEIGVTVPPFHSHCYDKTTEIYTNEGWKLFKDLKENELVYTINPENLEPEWQKPINYISYKYQGNMISFKNSRFDLVVTPNHSILVQNTDNSVKDKSWKLKEASKVGRKSKHRMFSGLNWNGIKKEYETLAGKKVDINTYLKFMAYWLSDGSCTFNRNSFNVKIAQCNNDWMYEELKEFPFKIYKCKESLIIHNKELGEELSKFGKCTTKFIPDNIKELNPELIRIFLIAYSKADGTLKKGKIWKGYKFNDSIQFFTSSDKLASDLGELILKAGGRPSYYLNKCAVKEIEFRNGVYTINKDVWTIRWNTQVHNYLYNMEIADIEYDDSVYCVEVPKYHTLLVRRNGKVCWSGNCRTVIAPYFDDESTRASRDENGEYKEVKYMNYKEWKDQYIKKSHTQVNNKNNLESKNKSDIIKLRNDVIDKEIKENVLKDFKNTSGLSPKGKQILRNLGLDENLKFEAINARGLVSSDCDIELTKTQKIMYREKFKIMKLSINDYRDMNYREKTIFHESYHAMLNNKLLDVHFSDLDFMEKWRDIEEVFAESSGHYLTDLVGNKSNLGVSYPERMVEILPRLKKFRKFKECESISDFGRIVYYERYKGKNAIWLPIRNVVFKQELDTLAYSKQYIEYIEKNKSKISLLLQKNNPELKKEYTQIFINNGIDIIKNAKSLNELNDYEKTYFYNVLASAMKLKGVK